MFMDILVSQDELAILKWLHNRNTGFGEQGYSVKALREHLNGTYIGPNAFSQHALRAGTAAALPPGVREGAGTSSAAASPRAARSGRAVDPPGVRPRPTTTPPIAPARRPPSPPRASPARRHWASVRPR